MPLPFCKSRNNTIMIIDIDLKIEFLSSHPSDINEHFPAIIEYGKKCDHITEMGMRAIVSTWGWLAAKPKTLIAYDIQDPTTWNHTLDDISDTAKSLGTDFKFIKANVLDVEIEETDLLFIDTWHAYKQLKAELALHAPKVRKYICFHDTTSFATIDERSYESWGDEWKGEGIGIWKAIEEFLDSNKDWELKDRFMHNNGLTFIGKKGIE